jgi:hypothetical protein
MIALNSPAVVAEIAALHDAYERALAANDVPALTHFFWDSPHIVRFGVNEHLYGAADLADYRKKNPPVFTDRVLLRRTIVAFGETFVSVMCEFSQKIAGQPRHSRQSQVWTRFPELGWRIVAAHVSNALTAAPAAGSWDAYVDQTAAALALPLDPAHRPGVMQNLQRSAAIAAPLLAFALPASAEPAPTFAA